MDFAAYRRYEALGCQDVYSWRLKQIHNLHVFEKCGFPLVLESIDDLKWILDTMHEARFERFARELGGLAEEDVQGMRAAVELYGGFFVHMFSSSRGIVPLSTLLAHHVVSRNLAGYVRGMGIHSPRILEIGPGCGYLSFFLKQWPDLGHYAQIEAAPSFYILQHWVNKLLFGAGFVEHANPEQGCSGNCAAAAFVDGVTDLEPPRFAVLRTRAVCTHYPWWRIGDLRSQRYDIVVSNANLNEFSREAFAQYAQLAYEVLDDRGMFYAQCIGGGQQAGETYGDMLRRIFGFFYQLGFAPLMVHLAQATPAAERAGDASPSLLASPFCLPKVVLIKPGHPLYAQCRPLAAAIPVCPELPILHEMFRPNSADRARWYSKDDLLQIVLPAGCAIQS